MKPRKALRPLPRLKVKAKEVSLRFEFENKSKAE